MTYVDRRAIRELPFDLFGGSGWKMFAGGPVHVFIHDAILSSLYIITQSYLSVSE